eukprot:COSAG01_NODE_782_length_13631_cov_73.763450_6_plen_163_part_00
MPGRCATIVAAPPAGSSSAPSAGRRLEGVAANPSRGSDHGHGSVDAAAAAAAAADNNNNNNDDDDDGDGDGVPPARLDDSDSQSPHSRSFKPFFRRSLATAVPIIADDGRISDESLESTVMACLIYGWLTALLMACLCEYEGRQVEGSLREIGWVSGLGLHI